VVLLWSYLRGRWAGLRAGKASDFFFTGPKIFVAPSRNRAILLTRSAVGAANAGTEFRAGENQMAQKTNGKNSEKEKTNLVNPKKGEIVTTTAQETGEKPKGESRGHYPATTVYGLTADQIAQGIKDGLIAQVGETAVVIRGKGNVKDEFVTYDKHIALNDRGEAFLCGGKSEVATPAPEKGEDTRTDAEKAKGSADHFNYGFDLEVKRELRSKLAELIEGPAKAIAKAAQTMLDQGVAETLDDAVAMVKAGRLRKGLPV